MTNSIVAMEENCTSPYTSTKYTIVAGLSAATAFISLLASLFVVSLIVLFKKYRFFTQRLILYLVLSVILHSITIILHRMDCENERSSFYVGFCMATISITLYVFVWVAFNKHTDKLKYSYMFFIFVFPWLFNWI